MGKPAKRACRSSSGQAFGPPFFWIRFFGAAKKSISPCATSESPHQIKLFARQGKTLTTQWFQPAPVQNIRHLLCCGNSLLQSLGHLLLPIARWLPDHRVRLHKALPIHAPWRRSSPRGIAGRGCCLLAKAWLLQWSFSSDHLGPGRNGEGFAMPVKQRGFIWQSVEPALRCRVVTFAHRVPADFPWRVFCHLTAQCLADQLATQAVPEYRHALVPVPSGSGPVPVRSRAGGR